MFFTQEDYRKIEKWLLANSVKDTEFARASLPLKGNETVAFVQDGKNVNVFLKDLIEHIFLLGVSDFLNVTDKYGESRISLTQAIQLIPYKSRKIGQVITFLDEDGEWRLFQFQGERVNLWNNATLWVDLIKRIQGISIIDSEDKTATVDNLNQTSLTFADKNYNTTDYSGLGRVYLRKNIQRAQNPNTGIFYNTNLLTQQMISEENTIYIIQYDYNLSEQTIIIPNNSVLVFEGGSISNGTITGANTDIVSIDNNKIIFGKDTVITGIWSVLEIYDSWFYSGEDDTLGIKSLFALCNDTVINNVFINLNHKVSVTTNNGDVINVPSNTTIFIEGTIELLPNNFPRYNIIKIQDKNNIVISGNGKIVGDVRNHIGVDGEWGMGINILNSTDIRISKIKIDECWGDGIYIGQNNAESVLPKYIYIDDIVMSNNRRQGISVISAAYLFISNSHLYKTGQISTTSPSAGIDIEPNDISFQRVKEIYIDSCVFEENIGGGILFHNLPENSTVYVNNCEFIKNNIRFGNCNGVSINSCNVNTINLVNNTSQQNIIMNSCVFNTLKETDSNKYKPSFIFNRCLFNFPLSYHSSRNISIPDNSCMKVTLPENAAALLEVVFVGNYNTKNMNVINRTLFNINENPSYIEARRVRTSLFRPDSTTYSYQRVDQTILFSNPIIDSSKRQVHFYIKNASSANYSFSGTLSIKAIIKYNSSYDLNWNNIKLETVPVEQVTDNPVYDLITDGTIAGSTEDFSKFAFSRGELMFDTTIERNIYSNGVTLINEDGTLLDKVTII